MVLSGLIGIERSSRQKGAGLRTHILVGIGATLIVLTSFHVFDIYKDVAEVDPTRMLMGIVTGIGFLCAGTIITGGATVMGLTTAAALWVVASIGMAVGTGHYLAAIIVAVVTFIVLTFARSFERVMGEKFKNII